MRYLTFWILIGLLVALGIYIGSPSNSQPQTFKVINNSFTNESYLVYALKLPAVNSKSEGILADLELIIRSGDGKVYTRVDGDSPLVNTDTQNSMRRAVKIARDFTHVKINDLYFSMNSGSDLVGGISAGAAFTVMTIAALKGEKLRNDTLITGSIELDGSIGVVGKVLEKAAAIKKNGYTRFLVPKGEGTILQQKENCVRKDFDNGFYESCNATPFSVSIENKTGLTVIEVSNFSQAYDLMIQH